jgi:hypothetical protein
MHTSIRIYLLDYASRDADYFLNMGQTILGLPSAGISTITDAVFEDIVGTISEISGWDQSQLTAWAAKAKTVSFHFPIIQFQIVLPRGPF